MSESCPNDPRQEIGTHCHCWWDGETCHYCNAPAATDAEMEAAEDGRVT